jgi:hypothetical protein
MAGAAIASAALEEAGIVPVEVGIGAVPEEAIMPADLVVPDLVSDRVVAPGRAFAPVAVRDLEAVRVPAVAPTLAVVLDLAAAADQVVALDLAVAASPADR